MANNTDNYVRLNYSSTRYLDDFMFNSDSLSASELATLIADKKTEVITNASDNEQVYKIWYDLYNFVPDWILSQLYDEIVAMPKNGAMKCFLDSPVFGSLMMTKLLVGTLEAYNIQDYKEAILAGDDVILQPKALSRTAGSKSIGDMSISFESERLGIDISTPFEQYLSTLPNGIEILEFYKNCLHSQPRMGIV